MWLKFGQKDKSHKKNSARSIKMKTNVNCERIYCMQRGLIESEEIAFYSLVLLSSNLIIYCAMSLSILKVESEREKGFRRSSNQRYKTFNGIMSRWRRGKLKVFWSYRHPQSSSFPLRLHLQQQRSALCARQLSFILLWLWWKSHVELINLTVKKLNINRSNSWHKQKTVKFYQK